MKNLHESQLRRYAPLLIIFLTFLVYSKTLPYPWHLDDLPNIVKNPAIWIDDLSWKSLSQSFSAGPLTGDSIRSLSYLTFSLNWYLGKDNTLGYHLVNIFIHIATALSLFYCILLLLKSPKLHHRFNTREQCYIALIATLFWSLHPIQIQAVTYIVQRMAALATFFSILAIIVYIKSFYNKKYLSKIKHIIFCLLFFTLGIMSKTNAAMLPCTLLLIHFIFFKQDKNQFSITLFRLLLAVNIIFLIISIYILFSLGIIESFFSFEHHANRPFSLFERLLTQPRIIFFYISLLLFPFPWRFSIDHSIYLSTSLLDPWTTLPATLCIISLVFFSLVNIKKHPIIAFSILFFFLNHIIESSILPLELIFEHRNYLPSLFLFFPLAVWLVIQIRNFQLTHSKSFYVPVAIVLILLFFLGTSTYLRNQKWATEEILWTDALAKAPDNARPYSYLGRIYGWEKPPTGRNLEKSIEYYHEALGKMGPLKSFDGAILGNIGAVYFNHRKYELAKKYYQKSIDDNDRFLKYKFGLAETNVLLDDFGTALQLLDEIIADPNVINVEKAYNLKGLIYLWQERYDEAVESLRIAIEKAEPSSVKYHYNMGIALSSVGQYQEATYYLKEVLRDTPKDILIMFAIIENEARSGNNDVAIKYSQNLAKVFTTDEISTALHEPSGTEKYKSAPLDRGMLAEIFLAANVITSDAHSTYVK